MTTLDAPLPPPPFDRQQVQAALDRGEIVRLLVEVDAGRISRDQFLDLLDERDRKGRWLRVLFASLFR